MNKYFHKMKRYVMGKVNNYAQEAYAAYERLTGVTLDRKDDGSFAGQGRNNELDAFRHAYSSAAMTWDYNAPLAHLAGYANELYGDWSHNQPAKERKMDEWNNAAGRRIGSTVDARDDIPQRVMQALDDGKLIIDPSDSRAYSPLNPMANHYNGMDPYQNWFDSYPDFSDAEQEASPIVFDLDGDGVKTLSLAATRHFDLDNSGFAEQTAWVDSGDGLLVLDLDGNGRIERGAELFGNHTALGDGTNAADGYAALAQYDDNGDGRIDAGDAIWQQLQVWRDSDSDARSRAEELHALADFDITAISLAATEVNERDAAGNRITHRGEVRRADDSVSAAADVWFQVNTAVSVYQGDSEVSAEIEALPNVQAFGNVPDLHIAMQRDPELKRQVKAYLAADEDSRGTLLDALIYRWSGSEGVAANSRGRYFDARKLVALEHLTGRNFFQYGFIPNPEFNAGKILKKEYAKFAAYTRAALLLQTDAYGELVLYLYLAVNGRAEAEADSEKWRPFAEHLRVLHQDGQSDRAKTEHTLLSGILTYSKRYRQALGAFWAENTLDYLEMLNAGIVDIDTVLNGNAEANTLTGSAALELLLGHAGNDTLRGDADADTLVGGAGDDHLEGGNYSADTYLFTKGHGKDVISDYASRDEESDTLRFAATASGDAVFSRRGNDLVIAAYGRDDQVRIERYFSDRYHRYFTFAFSDTTLTVDDLAKRAFTFSGTEANDRLTGWVSADTIAGGAGNDWIGGGGGEDTITGGAGDDTLDGQNGDDRINGGDGNDTLSGGAGGDHLDGGAGNDTLRGDAGEDTLVGGAGDDRLEGGYRSADTYVFTEGHGKDTVSDYAFDDKNSDTLRFAGAASGDAVFSRRGNDLVIAAYGGDDQVRIERYFSDRYHRYFTFAFSDTTLTVDDLAKRAFTFSGTETNDSLSGWVSADTIAGGAGNDWIGGGGGEDTLTGGAGDDTLDGQDGDDRVNGGVGNDTLSGGAGGDHLDGGAGNDTLRGDAGEDTLVGGAGDDRLEGGYRSADTYVFAKGHGKDTVSDYAFDDKNSDTLRFADSAAADLWFTRKDYDLAIETLGTEDQVIISNWFSSANYRRFDVQSSDGKAIDNDQVAQLVSAMAAFGAGENDAAASIVEQKRAFLAGIGAAEIWQADAS